MNAPLPLIALCVGLWASSAVAYPENVAPPDDQAAPAAAAADAAQPSGMPQGDFPPAMMQAMAQQDGEQGASAPAAPSADGDFPPAMMQAMAEQEAAQAPAPEPRAEAEVDQTISQLAEPPKGKPVKDRAEIDRRAQTISEGLRCPVCQGLSAADSQAESAIAMRIRAGDLVAAGYSDAQINSYFVERYGEWVLLEPPRSGRHWLIWFGPLAFLGLGALIVAWRMTAVAAPTTTATSGDQDDEDSYERRILDELERS